MFILPGGRDGNLGIVTLILYCSCCAVITVMSPAVRELPLCCSNNTSIIQESVCSLTDVGGLFTVKKKRFFHRSPSGTTLKGNQGHRAAFRRFRPYFYSFKFLRWHQHQHCGSAVSLMCITSRVSSMLCVIRLEFHNIFSAYSSGRKGKLDFCFRKSRMWLQTVTNQRSFWACTHHYKRWKTSSVGNKWSETLCLYCS